jgi:release factor glutamine methyltransferase
LRIPNAAFEQGSWFESLGGQRFDVVVSNPPYVAGDDPHLDVLRSEPRAALVAGADGLDALRRIIAGAPTYLAPRGALLVEHGAGQGAAVRASFDAAGYSGIQTRRDVAGLERATGGRHE